jgi:hypothetical protein
MDKVSRLGIKIIGNQFINGYASPYSSPRLYSNKALWVFK